jgi:hypothetical protein
MAWGEQQRHRGDDHAEHRDQAARGGAGGEGPAVAPVLGLSA